MNEPYPIPRPTLPLRARELARYRRSRSVTTRRLADRLGTSSQYVSHVEAGRTAVSQAQLDRILAAIDAEAAS